MDNIENIKDILVGNHFCHIDYISADKTKTYASLYATVNFEVSLISKSLCILINLEHNLISTSIVWGMYLDGDSIKIKFRTSIELYCKNSKLIGANELPKYKQFLYHYNVEDYDIYKYVERGREWIL